ncbi:hypothetical protein XBJ2_1810049 [Xenorhabdus bovienii str. Jollieti]|nr:hypothetical protein XBJ2_1810049 [Xenorhabdus bovienii str. Jollieti]
MNDASLIFKVRLYAFYVGFYLSANVRYRLPKCVHIIRFYLGESWQKAIRRDYGSHEINPVSFSYDCLL